ncbi:MAG: peptidoglycan DD-metalloendopeptidase family protein [Propionicimonas sp.]
MAATLIGGLLLTAMPAARADDLDDERDKVRDAIAQTKQDVAESRDQVSDAQSDLTDSEQSLTRAKEELALTEQKLAAAKARDTKLAHTLAEAKAALALATAAAERAQAAVTQQQGVIAGAVRTAYQQQTDVDSWGVIFDAETPTQLASRLQWTDTIFDASSAEMTRLITLQAAFEQAQRTQSAAAARVAEQKRLSADVVAEIAQLAAEATSRRTAVAKLVAANQAALDEAQGELEADQAAYDELQRQEAAITAKIKAQIARDKQAESGQSNSAESNSGQSNSRGFVYPVKASPGSPFGLRFHPILQYWRMHWGQDFGAACGAPLYAMADGRVTVAGWQSGGFGNYTIISYGRINDAYVSSGYAHQSKIVVRSGQTVKQGQVVGYVGTTGLSTGCHLHLQIYRDGVRVNPMKYL